MFNILVADKIAEEGLALLKAQADVQVTAQSQWKPGGGGRASIMEGGLPTRRSYGYGKSFAHNALRAHDLAAKMAPSFFNPSPSKNTYSLTSPSSQRSPRLSVLFLQSSMPAASIHELCAAADGKHSAEIQGRGQKAAPIKLCHCCRRAVYFLNSMPITGSQARVYWGKLKKMWGTTSHEWLGLVRDFANNFP